MLLSLSFLGFLWLPSTVAAYYVRRRRWSGAFRFLRLLLPLQLVAAALLILTADVAGLRNPLGYIPGITALASACGVVTVVFRYR